MIVKFKIENLNLVSTFHKPDCRLLKNKCGALTSKAAAVQIAHCMTINPQLPGAAPDTAKM
jgi:hypothetical protein